MPEVKISLYEISPQVKEEESFRYILKNARVTNYAPIVNTEGKSPSQDSVALVFEDIIWEYLDGNIQSQSLSQTTMFRGASLYARFDTLR